jgi:putative transposase
MKEEILLEYISRHRNMLVVELFLRSLVKLCRRHTVYSDGGGWYPEASCISLRLKHRLHSTFEKSVIERAMEYVKDRTENFDDYYPCIKKEDCNLSHVYQCMVLLFLFMHNTVTKSHIKFSN